MLAQVQKFETRKGQLQQRVTLIEQLRKGQAAPARVLDQISRSVPDRLWLADLKQAGNDFTLDGFATSMTALSDFVVGIEGTKWFRKPVEIIDSQVTSDAKNGDLVRFTVKASYFDPNAPLPPRRQGAASSRRITGFHAALARSFPGARLAHSLSCASARSWASGAHHAQVQSDLQSAARD